MFKKKKKQLVTVEKSIPRIIHEYLRDNPVHGFNLVRSDGHYQIFKNSDKYTAVGYIRYVFGWELYANNEELIGPFKKIFENLNINFRIHIDI